MPSRWNEQNLVRRSSPVEDPVKDAQVGKEHRSEKRTREPIDCRLSYLNGWAVTRPGGRAPG